MASLSGFAARPHPGPNDGDERKRTTEATIQDFINPDPLGGQNGMPTSPAITANYGGINLGIDEDGDAIDTNVEQDIRYFDHKYYMYGTSYSCGTFAYAPGNVVLSPLQKTTPASLQRYCGSPVYVSEDLMNWKLVTQIWPQNAETGDLYTIKKPRVIYSPKTHKYVMWFLNGEGTVNGLQFQTMEASSPTGPWSQPTPPSDPMDPTQGNLGPDFEINVGPDGTGWLITSHNGVHVLQLNPEMNGIVNDTVVDIANNMIGGGIGLSYNDGWWYITGSNRCGNCVASATYYLMAKSPQGPWMSPLDGSTATPVVPAQISDTTGNAQIHGANMLPGADGELHTLTLLSHYISSPTGAPGTVISQSGDNNLALAGIFYYPFEYDTQGHILPIEIKSSYTFPLAAPVTSSVPDAYQADLNVTASTSISQSWDLTPGQPIRSIMPAVFQRTPDNGPRNATVIQDPLVNASLDATLTVGGKTYRWSIDPRNVSWAPKRVPLNLPESLPRSGRATLVLSTTATNGGYGVAVGPSTLPRGQYAHVANGVETAFSGAGMLLTTSKDVQAPPRITSQPHDITVKAGSWTGFLVQAEGLGLGYQWTKFGNNVTAADGLDEATAPNLRFQNVTEADSGLYQVTVSNPAGSVYSATVKLTVVP
jgi:hypothetical protein